MLVIGHRGAKGLAPENTIESLREGFHADADMLEFDVRLTLDGIAVLSHDPHLHGVHIKSHTLNDIKKIGPVTTLEEVLDEFFGRILLNLEYKPKSDILVIHQQIEKKYIQNEEDWGNIIFSSFHIKPLMQLRNASKDICIALLHSINPFSFVAYHRKLKFIAVGWHRLHVNNLAIEIARKANIFSYVYTVNRREAAVILSKKGIDAIVTDHPDKMRGI